MPDYNFTIGTYPTKLSSQIKILTGQRFHRLLVIGFAGLDEERRAMWHCLCDCGNGCTVTSTSLRPNKLRSCGCWTKERLKKRATHGEASPNRSSEYRAYCNAKARCCNPQDEHWHNYGERGIEFRFVSYEQFLVHIGRKPTARHSLERIDNNGHYEVGNVKWDISKNQNRNQRRNHLLTAFGKTQCISAWAEEYGIDKHTIRGRVTHGWCDECSVSIPTHGGGCSHRI